MIGDLDPIKAARAGLQLSDELTMHYGLLPRANRGIFAINELPDLAGKIQVGLFNILQEGDVQIKGYPVRLPLDVLLVFSANPEDYTARGKIITPLKDRIGSEIRTHYPATRQHAMAITAQEAWIERDGCDELHGPGVRPRGGRGGRVPGAAGSEDRQALRRQPAPADLAARERRLERRAPRARSPASRSIVPRITDIYAALPAITGKFELEYEGELRGADNVARDIIRAAVGNVFDGYFAERRPAAGHRVVRPRRHAAGRRHARRRRSCSTRTAQVQGLHELAAHAGVADRRPAPLLASAVDFVLEGLYAQKKISRSDEWPVPGRRAGAPRAARRHARTARSSATLPHAGQQEEVLQLTAAHELPRTMKYRYSKFTGDDLDEHRSRGAALAAVRSAAVERLRQPVRTAVRRRRRPGTRCSRCTTPSSRRS